MSVFQTGASTDVGGLVAVNVNDMKDGEYVNYYTCPPLTFDIISPDTLNSIINGWLNYKNSDVDTTGGLKLTVEGISINTDTGDIYIKYFAQQVAPKTVVIGGQEVTATVSQAGINPLAVLAVLAALFAALDIGLTLMVVYEAKGSPLPAAASTAWYVFVGIAVGIAGLVIYALYKGKLKL